MINLTQLITIQLPITILLLAGVVLAVFIIKTALNKWWWINFAKYADTIVVNEAKKSAGGSTRGDLSKTLPFTEEDYRFNLLYNHIRVGQIEPKKMRRLHRKYLDYIAGMGYEHPDLLNPYIEPKGKNETDEVFEKRRKEAIETSHCQLTKLQGNVSRAKHELTIRNLFWATMITAIAVLGGAILGSSWRG